MVTELMLEMVRAVRETNARKAATGTAAAVKLERHGSLPGPALTASTLHSSRTEMVLSSKFTS